MRIFNTLVICAFSLLSVAAQIPSGYYNSTAGLYGDSLKAALHQIISGHTPLTYSQLHTAYPFTDARPDNTVWDMYSDIPGGTAPYTYNFVPADQCGNYSGEGDCYNREHSFPKSWFGGEIMPMYTDIFHVYPTDGYVNGQRGSLPYGETQSPNWTSMNGSKRGNSSVPGYSGTVFEPIDAFKGDFARTYFYMATRYYGEDSNWPGSPMMNGAEPKPWALSMLLLWHQQDGVSQKEIDRNNAAYSYQGNRNPFIDDSYFVDRIWITLAQMRPEIMPITFEMYPNPACERLYIRFAKKTEKNYNLEIRDLWGRLMMHSEVAVGVLETSIGIEQIPSALYFLSITSGDKSNLAVRKIHIYNR